MELDMTWGELARAAGGRLEAGDPAVPVGGVSLDTRSLKPGEAYWALKGERFDGHAFLLAARDKGAGGWIVEGTSLPAGGSYPPHILSVASTLKALQALAAHHRRRFEIPVVGITGSNGKTTTKEMLKAICARVGPTCSTPGNWNNQVGVPLSVLQLKAEHAYGVFELADSHPGDIDEVARVAQPTVGLITNIGPDHLEFYGSMEANFKTKSELIERLPEDAPAVINIDDQWLSGLEPRLGARAVTFGMNPRARVAFCAPDELIVDRHKMKLKLAVFGELSRYNAAAAAAAAWAMGIAPEKIRQGLEDYRPGAMRLEPMAHASGCRVVFDAYNANPASMKAAVAAFLEQFPAQRKVLVLGDMKELGSGSAAFHEELGRWLATLPLFGVYLAGPEMAAAHAALASAKPPFAYLHAEGTAELAGALGPLVTEGAAFLFKASRAMRLETLLEPLEITRCSST